MWGMDSRRDKSEGRKTNEKVLPVFPNKRRYVDEGREKRLDLSAGSVGNPTELANGLHVAGEGKENGE